MSTCSAGPSSSIPAAWRFQMDEGLAHRIYAGADMFLMPSQFEPCGLSQMISLRYGCVPVVRETGGLRDTVLSYNHYNNAGNGFTFFNYNAHDMLFVIRRALRYYWEHKDIWWQLQQRGMRGDYSWDVSADTYLALYENMLKAAAEARKAAEEAAEASAEEAPKKRVRKPAEKKEPAAEKKPAAKKTAAKKPAAEKKEAAPRKKAAKKTEE